MIFLYLPNSNGFTDCFRVTGITACKIAVICIPISFMMMS